jgi:hypothetical protein
MPSATLALQITLHPVFMFTVLSSVSGDIVAARVRHCTIKSLQPG